MIPKKIIALITFLLIISACKKEKPNEKISLNGFIFGTSYNITYLNKGVNYQKSIDSLFFLVNKSLSTYIPTSDISKINKGDTNVMVDDFFVEVFNKSKKIYRETDGYFDPTVGNLVNAWGFGPKNEKQNLTEEQVKMHMQLVGLNKVQLISRKIVKETPELFLDFNSIAKGFGVDVIARFLESKKVDNYLIEIGGEVRARGNSDRGKPWVIGLDNPKTDGTRSVSRLIPLKNMSIAGSGNFRKFRLDENGNKYVHTVNPKTGFATESNLLSAYVIADLDCADVDAYATAFMAMGLEKTKEFIKTKPDVKVVLHFLDSTGNIKEFSTYTFN